MKKKISMIPLMVLLAILSMVGTVSVAQSAPQVPPREKTLYVDIDGGRVADPTNWNWLIPGVRRDHGYHQCILEALFYVNYETGDFVPWVAEGYEYSPDFMTFTIKLRRGVKWSDGKPLTADDLVFTYNTLLEYAPKVAYSTEAEYWIKSVRKVDDYTVEVNLNYPNPRFHYSNVAGTCRLWGSMEILPKHIFEGKDPLTFKFYPPVGTGPYKLVSASETTIVYERRDDWWATEVFGIRPAPQYVIYIWYGPEETRAMRMAAHELDSICDIAPGTYLKVVEKNPYVRAWHVGEPYAWLDPCPRYMSLTWKKYPFNIPEVRRAISYLVDRDEIIRVAYENSSYPSWGPFPFYGGLQPYFDAIEDLIEKYDWLTEYNPAKAEEIFTGLGFTKGADGIWVTPNGTRLELTLLVPAPWIEKRRIAVVLIDQLIAGGVDIVQKIIEVGPYGDAIMSGQFDAALIWSCPGDTDPFFTLDQWTSKYYKPVGVSSGGWHLDIERYKNPEYDAILAELEKTSPDTDLEKCKELFRKAMDIWFTDMIHGVQISQARKLIPFDTFYWVGWPTADNAWIHPCNWWASFLLTINGYQSPKTGEWVGGIRPTTIDYTTVYFTKDVSKFRGIDLAWYGPLKAGEAARIPTDDAEFWIRKGYASYTPVIPTPEFPELAVIAETVSGLSTSVDEVKSSVESLRSDVAGISGTVTSLAAGIIIEAIVIIVLGVALLRRRPEE